MNLGNALRAVTGWAAAFGLMLFFMVLGLDALEYETTGKCVDCLLLTYNR